MIRQILRVCLGLSAALLVTGLGASLVGGSGTASRVAGPCLAAGLGLLVAIPVLNVVAVLIAEVRDRDWRFVAATAVVLTEVVYNVVHQILIAAR